MVKKRALKLSICYSHLDEAYVEEFKKHIALLKRKDLIEEWYDRKIIPGQEVQKEIDDNLNSSDIICLFISANFLSSSACMDERDRAFDLRAKKGVVVAPIILSACEWNDDEKLSSLLALPKDGKPVKDYSDSEKAWKNIYDGIKEIVQKD